MFILRRKIRLRHNVKMTDSEYSVACTLCDIVAEVLRAGAQKMPGGIFYDTLDTMTNGKLYERKNRAEIDHSILLHMFRDFPTLIYDDDCLTPKPDFWVRRYVRLCRGVSRKWRVQIPARFGEIGWKVNGFPVNRHTAVLQERINAQLYLGMETALAGAAPRVLEIGGGAGEMAYTLCKGMPNITFYNCDLPNSLIYAAIHLAVWLPKMSHRIYVGNLPVKGVDKRYIVRSVDEAASAVNSVIHIPHFLIEDFQGKLALNLALNGWSFSEMPEGEVRRYGAFIKQGLVPNGMLIEENGEHKERGGCNAKEILQDIFPVRLSFETAAPHLPRGGLSFGAIDRWTLTELPTDTIDTGCLENPEAVPPHPQWRREDFMWAYDTAS